jgi:general secretion pathway protein M
MAIVAIKEKVATALTAVMNHEQVKQAKQRFDHLSERDRFAVKILSLFIALCFVWLIVFYPIDQFAAKQAFNYKEAKSLLTWMRSNEVVARQIASLSTQSGNGDAQSLIGIINLAAKNRAITVKRLEPEGQRNISVWLESAPYEPMMLWLFDLQEQNKIHIKQITIDKQPEAGYVNVHVLFGV